MWKGDDMDELISKKAVIEAIEKARANVGHNLERSIGKTIIEILDDVGRDVDRLPSAHGTNLAEDGTDCISRQQAINALDECYCGGEDSCGEPWVYKENAVEAIQMIEPIPSAQPEIIRCKDCKHFEYDHVENVNGIPLIVAHEICMRWSDGVKTSENGYCFLGKRRERQHE